MQPFAVPCMSTANTTFAQTAASSAPSMDSQVMGCFHTMAPLGEYSQSCVTSSGTSAAVHPIVFEPLQLPNLAHPPAYSLWSQPENSTSLAFSFPSLSRPPANHASKFDPSLQMVPPSRTLPWQHSHSHSNVPAGSMPPPPAYSNAAIPQPQPHTKLVFRSESSCIYPRLPRGFRIRVSAPNNRQPIDDLPSETLLLTRGALGAWRDLMHAVSTQPPDTQVSHRSLSHCAHYFFNHICNRGEQCGFVHVLVVNPELSVEFAPCEERVVIAAPRPSKAGCGSPRPLGSPTLGEDSGSVHLRSIDTTHGSSLPQSCNVGAPASPLQPDDMSQFDQENGDERDASSLVVEVPQQQRTHTAPVAPLQPRTGMKFHFDPYRGGSGPTMRFLST